MAVLEVTKDNFKQVVQENQTVIVDFWAVWCGPCKRFAPIFEAVADKHPDIKFIKINTDEEPEIAGSFEVQSIPTLAVIKEQSIIFVQPGAVNEDILEQIVKRAKEIDMSQVEKE
ncbi:thioredoxin [Bdellovibrio sp. SKB1291214]|uniref:thioredoxin n=1 Tax=Bdellovibrio sp. SKB1291214 TaxID=1732569 RepID=UPI000B51BAE0|nr:thioredoxin [Bdellovibrio sp. SKB1291214]UYL10413.1 thioredoxin [Bdellovibrio sp. SKB1291214]